MIIVHLLTENDANVVEQILEKYKAKVARFACQNLDTFVYLLGLFNNRGIVFSEYMYKNHQNTRCYQKSTDPQYVVPIQAWNGDFI